MFKLNQDSGKNCFIITDRDGCQIFGTKEELEEICQQITRVKGGLPQEKENTHIVILESDYNTTKIQMELSDSAYRLLCYLQSQGWLDSEAYFVEIDKANFEKFI